MAGFGSSEYGGSGYGIGDGGSSPITTAGSILVHPRSGNIGDPVVIANRNSPPFVDTARDDYFIPASIPNPTIWNTNSTGSVGVTVNNGLFLELRKQVGGSSYNLTSIASYVSGYVSVEYNILSEFLSDTPAATMVYAGLEMQFSSGAVFNISRMLSPGINGHQIAVTYSVGSTLYGSANLVTTANSGELSLIKHDGVLTAMFNDQILFHDTLASLGNFVVRLYTNTGNASEYLKTKFTKYKSNTGAIFGNAPLVPVIINTTDRLTGNVPPTQLTGPVTVSVFNHSGLLGSVSPGFNYNLVEGQHLSPNSGLHGTIQEDSVLRD